VRADSQTKTHASLHEAPPRRRHAARKNIVAVYDYGEEDGRPYMVMEYLRGEDLRERIREGPQRFDRPIVSRWRSVSRAPLSSSTNRAIIQPRYQAREYSRRPRTSA